MKETVPQNEIVPGLSLDTMPGRGGLKPFVVMTVRGPGTREQEQA
jgi:hypothetical protein